MSAVPSVGDFVKSVRRMAGRAVFAKVCRMAAEGRMKFGRTFQDFGPNDLSGG